MGYMDDPTNIIIKLIKQELNIRDRDTIYDNIHGNTHGMDLYMGYINIDEIELEKYIERYILECIAIRCPLHPISCNVIKLKR